MYEVPIGVCCVENPQFSGIQPWGLTGGLPIAGNCLEMGGSWESAALRASAFQMPSNSKLRMPVKAFKAHVSN